MGKHRILAPDRWGAGQRNDFSEPRLLHLPRASEMALVVKNSPANAGDIRDVGLILGLGRSPGVGNSKPLQSSCLDNPMDRGAWRATAYGVAKSQTQLKRLSTCTEKR